MRNLSGNHPFDGARVSNILPSVADELNLDETDGVVIVAVRSGRRRGAPRLPAGRHHRADRQRQDHRRRHARRDHAHAATHVERHHQARRAPDEAANVRITRVGDAVRSRRTGEGRAAPARRPAAAEEAGRGRRPGSPRRPRRHADAHAEERPPAEPHPVGAARLRQDDGRAPAGPRDAARVRAAVGDLLRRAGSAQSLRPRQGAPRAGQGHAAVHRRDPPLQPRAAGQLPAAHGGRHHHARRRDDREPVLRAQRRRARAARPCWSSIGSTRRRSKTCWSAPRRRRSGRCRSMPMRARR